MLLRELFEAPQSVGLIFGRFNPPHKGHKAAWEMASDNSAWYVGTNKSTQGPKDPLPYDVKIKAMQTIMPNVAGHIIPHQSWLTLAAAIYKKHGDVELKVYTDEEWVLKALNKYNGVEGPHGMYKFSKITSVPTPRLSSATALRTAVANNDPKAFADAAGVPADTPVDGKPFFDLVAEYLGQYKKEGIKGGLAGAATGAYLGKGKPKAIITGYQLGSGAENLLKKKKKKKPEDEVDEASYNNHVGHDDLLSMPQNTLVIDTPGDLDWYKIGQHFPTLNKADPREFGQGDSDMVITFANDKEKEVFLKLAARLGLKVKDIGGTLDHPEIHSEKFASDAQRRAAFAAGYKPKGKKK